MSKGDSDRSLKSMHIKWLVMLAALDVLVVLVFVAPELLKDASWSSVAAMRVFVTALLPVVVLVLSGMVSHEAKAKLVYWKFRNPYPGCEAFTRHGSTDARIDMAALKKNVGDLPSEPGEQNKKWYKLYRMVVDDKAVVEAHKLYLMYRDMASLSLPLAAVVPVALYIADAKPTALFAAFAFFTVQYVACCVSARNAGRRLVCNVLAIHSTKKVTSPKPATA